jgi:hypothetical protein
MSEHTIIPQLIGIHGHAGVGKDTLALYLADKHENVWGESFARPLKDACAAMFGIPRDYFDDPDYKNQLISYWKMSPRVIAQFFGTEIVRANYGPDFWIDRLNQKLSNQQIDGPEYNSDDTVIITDVRFQNEYNWIIANGGVIIHLTRPGADGKVGIPNHSSEAGINLHNKEKTRAITNDSTLEVLYSKVDQALHDLNVFRIYQPSDF